MVCYLIPWLNLNKMQLYPVRRPLKSPPELLCQADSLVTRKAALERGGITELICKIVGLDTSQRMLMIFHSLFYSRVCVCVGGGEERARLRQGTAIEPVIRQLRSYYRYRGTISGASMVKN